MSIMQELIPEGYDSIVFLDIEATEYKEQRHILQLSAVKITKENKVSYFNQNCYFKHALPPYIQYLLNKPNRFWYRNINFKQEKQVYEEFVKFAGNSVFISYGDYDHFIIKSCCIRNQIDHIIKIIDGYKTINNLFNFPVGSQPSLTNFATVLGINFVNKHDALADAKALYSVFKKVYDSFEDKKYLQNLKREIYREMLKPKTKIDRFYNTIREQHLNKSFVYVVDKSTLKSKRISYESDELEYILNIDLRLVKRDTQVFKNINKQFTFKTKSEANKTYRTIIEENVSKYFHNCIWLYNNNRKFIRSYYKKKKYTLLMHYVPYNAINNYLKCFNFKFNSEKQELKCIIKEIERIWSKHLFMDNNICE